MNTPKIYLVEDDVFYNRTLQYALWHSEFNNVKAFTNREDFIREINFDEPDVVILDYHLGDTTSIDLLRNVKTRNRSIKVILMSAAVNKDLIQLAMNEGAMACIQKDKLAFSKIKVLIRKAAIAKKYKFPEAVAA